MARVPDGVNDEQWHGSEGKWFKIVKFLAKDKANGKIDHQPSVSLFGPLRELWSLPRTTPPGPYLLRVEQFAFWTYTQFSHKLRARQRRRTGRWDSGATCPIP